MFFFFFSSRSRHTRLQGDWSSDVCSSDLPLITTLTTGELRVKKGGTEQSLVVFGGFMEVTPDKVTILADSAERVRSEEHTSELQSPCNLVCRLLLEKKKQNTTHMHISTR